MQIVQSAHRVWAISVLAVSVAAGSMVAMPAHAESVWPASVYSKYDIYFASFRVGHFSFTSTVEGNRYRLASDAQVSVFFGSYKWRSRAEATGIAGRGQPTPESFDFHYRSSRKESRTRMTFAEGRVSGLDNQPPASYSSRHVPLKQEHLVSVLDPMTAIMTLTAGANGNPCRQTLDVFEGKQRFRLQLTPDGRVDVAERKRSNQPTAGYRCRARFIPIAGHKRSEQLSYVSRSRIEIIMRPVPAANIFVPVTVRIPTTVGDVVLTAAQVDISGPRQRIALRH